MRLLPRSQSRGAGRAEAVSEATTSLEAEARYFHLSAIRELGDRKTYVTLARELVTDFPTSEWAAETLNGLASHYLVVDEDAEADLVFRELAQSIPATSLCGAGGVEGGMGRVSQPAASTKRSRLFESAAAAFPRADYRPSWLYWSGRSRDQLNDAARRTSAIGSSVATIATRTTAVSRRRSSRRGASPCCRLRQTTVGRERSRRSKTPPTEALMRELTALQLYDEALREVQYAQRVWGDTPPLQATTAWIRHRQGLGLRAQERFTAIRGAITHDAPRLSAVSGGRRRGSSGRMSCRSSFHSTTGRSSRSTRSCTGWIRI